MLISLLVTIHEGRQHAFNSLCTQSKLRESQTSPAPIIPNWCVWELTFRTCTKNSSCPLVFFQLETRKVCQTLNCNTWLPNESPSAILIGSGIDSPRQCSSLNSLYEPTNNTFPTNNGFKCIDLLSGWRQLDCCRAEVGRAAGVSLQLSFQPSVCSISSPSSK